MGRDGEITTLMVAKQGFFTGQQIGFVERKTVVEIRKLGLVVLVLMFF